MPPRLEIFISHSSRDVETAANLITLLRAALALEQTEIRCTSVDGYRLPGGVDTNARLKQEVKEATVLLGILSQDSLRSLYVVFELGARWSSEKTFLPLLAPGAPTALLGGPLAGINTLRLDNRMQVVQLLRELAVHLGRQLQPDDFFSEALEAFVAQMDERQRASIAASLAARNLAQSPRRVDQSVIDEPSRLVVPASLVSPYFATDIETETCTLEKCRVLVCASTLSNMVDLLPILEQVARAKRPLLVVARKIEGEVLATLIHNTQRGVIQACAVATTSCAEPTRIERLIAKRSGATIFHDEAWHSLQNAMLSELGTAARVQASSLSTTFMFGSHSKAPGRQQSSSP